MDGSNGEMTFFGAKRKDKSSELGLPMYLLSDPAGGDFAASGAGLSLVMGLSL